MSAAHARTIPGALRVCRATAADVPRVVPLFTQYRQFYGAEADAAVAARFLKARVERGESVLLLALVDAPSEVAGFAQIYRSFSSVALGELAVLNDLFVAPAHRRGGVGARLIAAAADHARAAGALRLDLATQHTNAAALRLYRACGFVMDVEFAHLGLATAGAHTHDRTHDTT